jgi:5-methylcytosine-specific restriction endonuclease McrA
MPDYKMNVHHRKPRSLGGTNERSNLSTVLEVEHQAWHRLFSNNDPATIARIINTVWLDPEWEFVPVRRKT